MTSALMAPTNRKTELVQRETRITEHIGGAASEFKAIREESLYTEDGWGTWADYCVGRWGSSRPTIDRLIVREEMVENLADVVPAGTHITHQVAKELRDLPPADQKKAAAKLPKGKRKPSPADAKTARADAGLPPKRQAQRRLNLDSGSKIERESGKPSVSGYFESKPGASRIAQDASASETSGESNGKALASRRGGGGLDTPGKRWLVRFKDMCSAFAGLFNEADECGLDAEQRAMVALGLRGMAASVPDSIAWTGEVEPTAETVGLAVAQIERLALLAEKWTDTEAVAVLADKMRVVAGKLDPQEESDKTAVTVSEIETEFVALWKSSGLTPMNRMTPGRKRQLRTRLKDQYWRENWREAVERASKLKGLCAATRCNVDWFLKSEQALTRIMEGFYSSWTKAEHASRALDQDYGQSGRIK